MEKYIDVTSEVRQKIIKVFGVTERAIFNALKFDSKRGNSDKAKRIRQYAWQNGGVTMVVSKEVETIHDSDGYMRQYFPNGAMIEVDKNTGNLTAYFKGEEMLRKEDVNIRQLAELQDIFSLWTKRDAEIMTNPELRKKFLREA